MESFVRVVRAGSFTIGASQLGLSRALVSRHVSDLEARLGVRLLNRSTRSLSLTEEGTAYLEFCEKVFRDIESNERAIVRTRLEPVGTLKLLAPKSFGALHLSDAVIAFAVVQPRLRVSLMLENTPYRGSYDFAERDLDMVLCFSTVRSTSVVEQEIATLDWVVCASPDYLARAGRPSTPAELERSRLPGACRRRAERQRLAFRGTEGRCLGQGARRVLLQQRADAAQGGGGRVGHHAGAALLRGRRTGRGDFAQCAAALSGGAACAARGLSAGAGDPAQDRGLCRVSESLDGGTRHRPPPR